MRRAVKTVAASRVGSLSAWCVMTNSSPFVLLIVLSRGRVQVAFTLQRHARTQSERGFALRRARRTTMTSWLSVPRRDDVTDDVVDDELSARVTWCVRVAASATAVRAWWSVCVRLLTTLSDWLIDWLIEWVSELWLYVRLYTPHSSSFRRRFRKPCSLSASYGKTN